MADIDFVKLPDSVLPAIEDLNGDLRLLAEIVGVRDALRVAQAAGGTPLRLYGGHRLIRRLRDRAMRAEYDAGGITVVDLARKYGIGERQAYYILGRAEEDANEKQMNLW